MGTQIKSSPQLLGIQYLRGIAALMIVYLHLSIQIPAYTEILVNHLGANLKLSIGVDVFFVISGFIMVVSSGSATPAQFLLRRFTRVVPLYWLMTLLVVVGYWLQPAWFRSTVVSVEYVLKSLLFIPFVNPGHGGEVMPVLVPGWSLNFEMAFYVVFALALLLPFKHRLGAVGAVFLMLFAFGQSAWAQTLPAEFRFYVDPKLFEFWLGMVIGSQATALWIRRVPRWGVLSVLLGASILLLTPSSFYVSYHPMLDIWVGSVLPAGALVWAVVALEAQGRVPEVKAFQRLGDASYSIYLSHILTLGVVRMVWVRWGLAEADLPHVVVFASVAVAAAVAVGWLVFVFIERPLHHGLKKLLSRKALV
jgi:exopolysaccharide production protein ExoZ